MVSNEVQSLNAPLPIMVTEEGIVMLINEVQSENAKSSMLLAKVQRKISPSPMLVTEVGIVMVSNEVQPKNALEPILVNCESVRIVMVSNEVQS